MKSSYWLKSDSHGQYLGKLEGNSGTITAKGAREESLNHFDAVKVEYCCTSYPLEFSPIKYGVTLAFIKKLNDVSIGAEVCLFKSQSLLLVS